MCEIVFWQWYCWTKSIGLAFAVFNKSGISLERRLQLSLASIRCILRGNDLQLWHCFDLRVPGHLRTRSPRDIMMYQCLCFALHLVAHQMQSQFDVPRQWPWHHHETLAVSTYCFLALAILIFPPSFTSHSQHGWVRYLSHNQQTLWTIRVISQPVTVDLSSGQFLAWLQVSSLHHFLLEGIRLIW